VHGDITWRDDHYRLPGTIRQRVNFISSTYAKSPSTAQKKRHICAEPCGNLNQAGGFHAFPAQAQETDERGSGVARASAEPSTDGNALDEHGTYAPLETKFAAQFIKRSVDKIVAAIFPGQGGIPYDAQIDACVMARFERQCIAQCDRLEDRAQLVIAVRAPPPNLEAQIDLCVSWNQDGFHGEVCYYGLASLGVFC